METNVFSLLYISSYTRPNQNDNYVYVDVNVKTKPSNKQFWLLWIKRMSVLEDDFELRPEMELVAIYFAVTVIRIIQMEGNHLELFNCPFEYSIDI